MLTVFIFCDRCNFIEGSVLILTMSEKMSSGRKRLTNSHQFPTLHVLFYRSSLHHLASVLKIRLVDGLKHIFLKGVHILQIINYSVAQMPTVSVCYVEDAHV